MVQMRATIYHHDKWVDLDSLSADPALSQNGILAEDFLLKQESNPVMSEALAKMRMKLGTAMANRVTPVCGIAALRMQKGFSQHRLAELMETQQPNIARWEKNPEQMTYSTLKKYAACLGIKEQVLFDTVEKNNSSMDTLNAPA